MPASQTIPELTIDVELRPDELALVERMRGEFNVAQIAKPWPAVERDWQLPDVLRYALRHLAKGFPDQ